MPKLIDKAQEKLFTKAKGRSSNIITSGYRLVRGQLLLMAWSLDRVLNAVISKRRRREKRNDTCRDHKLFCEHRGDCSEGTRMGDSS
jgi:hypothetical protein